MQAVTSTGVLPVIAAAVTPVVMLSATAALALSITNKYGMLAARIRALSTEYRHVETTAARRENIREQLLLFSRRFEYASRAHQGLYLAAICFTATALSIVLVRQADTWQGAVLVLFVVGILLTVGALCCELEEIRLGHQTLALELEDVRSGSPSFCTGNERTAGDPETL